MGGGYPAIITLFATVKPPEVVSSEFFQEMNPWKQVVIIDQKLFPQCLRCEKLELIMLGGWPNERLFEDLLALFEGMGSANRLPANEENCFFVVYSPAQARECLKVIARGLSPSGLGSSHDRIVLSIWHFVSSAVMEDCHIAITFANPP